MYHVCHIAQSNFPSKDLMHDTLISLFSEEIKEVNLAKTCENLAETCENLAKTC